VRTGQPDYEKVRARMVREQLIPRDITDPRVLKAMGQVPRHLFVEDALGSQAYGDFPLPIGESQTISQPYIVALMTQALCLQGHENILEIGTGSGYQAAILAQICNKIYSVERINSLLVRARRVFDQLHYLNILCKLDDGTLGWPQYAPFDAIVVTAAGPRIPAPLLDQLADPGVLLMPVGDLYRQELQKVSKKNGELTTSIVESVRFVKLVGAHGWQKE